MACFSVLALGVAGAAVAAEEATLADAAEHGNRALIGKLLDAGTDANAPQVDGTTALHWAVYRDDAETAALLVRAGADVNAENSYGVPPLSLAATNGSTNIVTLLLDAGAERECGSAQRRNRSHDGGAHGQPRRGASAPGQGRRSQRA